jgi:hypothetical protein
VSDLPPKKYLRMFADLTAALVLLAPAAVVAYDMAAARLGGPEATITNVVQAWAVRWPELPALTAAVMVWLWLHLFLAGIILRVNTHLPPAPPP